MSINCPINGECPVEFLPYVDIDSTNFSDSYKFASYLSFDQKIDSGDLNVNKPGVFTSISPLRFSLWRIPAGVDSVAYREPVFNMRVTNVLLQQRQNNILLSSENIQDTTKIYINNSLVQTGVLLNVNTPGESGLVNMIVEGNYSNVESGANKINLVVFIQMEMLI